MTDEEKGKCFEDMFEDKEYIERIKNTCFNHKLFNTVAYINKLEKENAELRKALNNNTETASATQLLELIQVREENERLEQEKCELLGIIQGKDVVIAELKEKIEKLKTEIESIRQKSVSRRSTINVLNTRLNSRLEQVERLKQENNKLWGENAELKKYKKICDNCKEEVVVQYRKLFNENEELEAQIEHMKCCENCYNFKKGKCKEDNMFWARVDKLQGKTCQNWELAE